MDDRNASGEIDVVAGSGPRDSLVIRFEIADRALMHEPERSVLCDEILQLVALHLARRAGAVAAPLAARKLERARSLIESSLGEPLRIRDLAAAAHMSPFHFSRLFKLATRESPHAYLTRRRIERAKELLAAQKLPLVHVASAVGFQTQGHFTEVFRRLTGTTPRKYRLAALPCHEPLSTET
ncbi:MAG TPA: helix-turn-helix transcriptional regulator [Burkholderiales bacterium]|nr:helix-turn-helix transcriptional regulator [Burkholderiales bacterium]